MNRDRVPFNAVIAVSFFSLVISIPALFGKNNIPFAFFALTGICTVGLYLAYIIPGLPAAAGGRLVQARPVEPGAQVQDGQHPRRSSS